MNCRSHITKLLLVAILLMATTAPAVDLDTNALVDIVEGITLSQVTALNFGDVALNTGTLSVATDASLTDPNFLSFDATDVSQGIFVVTAVAGGSYDISFVENAPVVGLTLNAFRLNIDGGADEAGTDTFAASVLANQSSTLNVGADLTVDSATAVLGNNQTIGYRVTVEFN